MVCDLSLVLVAGLQQGLDCCSTAAAVGRPADGRRRHPDEPGRHGQVARREQGRSEQGEQCVVMVTGGGNANQG